MIVLRGQGGTKVDFHFLIDSDRGTCQLPVTFYRMKKILCLVKVIAISNLKITYDYTARANFKRDLPKINLKILLLQQILR